MAHMTQQDVIISGAPRSGKTAMHRARALASAPSVLSLTRISGALAGFATQVLLARALHASALGLYYSVTSLAAVLGLIAAHGYPVIAPRFISRYRRQGREDLVTAFVRWARAESALYVGIGVSWIIVFALLWPSFDQMTRVALIAAAFSIPANAVLRVNGSIAMALRHFALAFLPDTCFRSFLLLFGVIGLILVGVPLSPADVIWVLVGAYTVVAAGQYLVLQRQLPKAAAASVPARLLRIWRREALPLILVVLFTDFFADVDILIATPLLVSADTGALGVCLKLALLVGFAVQVAQQVVVPDLADAHARKSYDTINASMLKVLGFPVAVTLGALICVSFWGDRLLALFGPEFAAAQPALVIIILSQFARALFGPSVGLLTVIGAQRQNAAIALCSMIVLVGGNVILAPLFGLIGAAFAVAIAVLFWMLTSAIVLYRLSGLRTDALFLLSKARQSVVAAG
jgi:O-antigen/teichoic acid export membrane protein